MLQGKLNKTERILRGKRLQKPAILPENSGIYRMFGESGRVNNCSQKKKIKVTKICPDKASKICAHCESQ